MKTKQIVFTEPYKTELLEKEINDPVGYQVLVKLCRSTVSSGTERANLVGEKNVTFAKNAVVPFPRTSGYSSSGIVVKVGELVKSVAVGDRVACSWSVHSQYNLLPEQNVHKIPFDDVSFGEAALAHVGTFPLAAIRKCHLEMGESAMVVGLGVLGLIAVSLLKAAGAYPVIAVDLQEEKLEQALQYGADYAFNSADPDFAEKVINLTGGVKVAIEVTGSGKALDTTLDCMARFGRVALLGCTRNADFTIDYYKKVHGPGVSLIGAHALARPDRESSNGLWTTHDDAMTILNLMHGGRIDLKKLIEEVHSYQDYEDVYKRLAENSAFPIVQFHWE